MNKRATTMLGALAIAASGFLFAAPAAQAQTLLDTISNGGVTCKQYTTNYDWQTAAQDTFWDCINTGSPPTSFEKLVPAEAKDLPAAMKNTLADVEMMIFANRTDFANFTGAAAPDSKYMAWTANSGPGNLSNKRIAAVFASAVLYSTSDDLFQSRDISALYKVHIMQAIGRQYDQLMADPAPLSTLQEASGNNPVHIFPIAVEYDAVWTNEEPVTTVWNNFLANLYQGETNWQILGHLYGNTSADIFAFQFAREFGSSYSHLHSFVNSHLEETEGYRHQQLFGHAPIRDVSGVYKPAAGGNPAKAVFCVKYDTIYNAPADEIRNCVHPYEAPAVDIQAGSAVSNLPVSFRNNLTSLSNNGNPPVTLYVMRDITDYETYFDRPPGAGGGDLGISFSDASGRTGPEGTVRPVVAFRDTLASFPGPIVDNYYKGTLVHEIGHVLDDQFWNTYSEGAAWENIVNADKTLFNQIANCMTALNDTEACSTTDPQYMGKSHWDRFLTKMGLYVANPQPADIDDQNREIFAYMFQKRASGADTVPFVQHFEGKIWSLNPPSMKNKMDSIWSTGSP